MMRNRLFQPVLDGVEDEDRRYKLTPLSALLGCDGEEDDQGEHGEALIVMGMLSQLKEGIFFLEDLDASVRLDMSGTTFAKRLFTEQSIVLAEGSYRDQVFHATNVMFPPAELRADTL
jgi:DNA polymerase epsilon subunit 2